MMKQLFSERFLAIDFETANHSRHSACSIGLVRVENNEIMSKSVHLIRPPTSEFLFTHIHGLTWNDVKTSPTFKELWPQVKHCFENIDYIVAHNAKFDSGVLKSCCDFYNIPVPNIPFRCSMEIARRTWKVYPTKLSDVCKFLNIKLNHHEALSDAHACARIVLASLE